MSDAVKVLVVDDDERGRDRLIELIRFADVQVVGESTLGAAAYTWASQLDVDVVLVAVGEPIARSLRTIESLAVGDHSWPVIGIADQNDRETVRKAIVAGVRDFLARPIAPEELRRAILNVHQIDSARRAAREQGVPSGRLGTIVTVFGVKGGIGKSTVAANVAVVLAQETQQHVALADFDLHFGDAAVLLDLVPEQTVADAARDLDPRKPHMMDGYLVHHPSRLKLLAAPPTPQAADGLGADQLGRVLEQLAATNDYVVVDTSAQLDATAAAAMDMSTIVLLMVTPEVPCVRRTKAALALMQESGYTRDKVKLVLNRTARKMEVSAAEIEEALDYPIHARIPDDRAVARSISVGVPLAMSDPKSKAGQALIALGRGLAGLEARPKQRLALPWAARRSEPTALPAAPLAVAGIRDAWESVLTRRDDEPAGRPEPLRLVSIAQERAETAASAATDEAPADVRRGIAGGE